MRVQCYYVVFGVFYTASYKAGSLYSCNVRKVNKGQPQATLTKSVCRKLNVKQHKSKTWNN